MNKQSEDIRAIREMMERSSKFLSLSGLSGITAGIMALVGIAFAYYYLFIDISTSTLCTADLTFILALDAFIVLLVSICAGIYFSWKKSKQKKLILSGSIIRKTIYNLSIPLIAGGIFSLISLLKGDIGNAIAFTLVFYGLALVNVSKYTFDEIHYLGITEIILGVIAYICAQYCTLLWPNLFIWAMGFGVCHIVYGLTMYIKYDLKRE